MRKSPLHSGREEPAIGTWHQRIVGRAACAKACAPRPSYDFAALLPFLPLAKTPPHPSRHTTCAELRSRKIAAGRPLPRGERGFSMPSLARGEGLSFAASSRHLPGGDELARLGVLGVLQNDAHRGQLVANAIRQLEVLRLACRIARIDQIIDDRFIDDHFFGD